ncbi:GGDEF domain-containing protein [bacterium]|nr:GGDEF domain-containing protein [bacterium]NBX82328.1 GGDEF domain-containing protein [bacterium]
MTDPKDKQDPSDASESTKTALADGDTLKIRLEEAKSIAPTLVVISGKPLGKSFYLTQETMILGRDLAADISIGETAISRRHTEFLISAAGVQVRDLGSTNGTFINDVRLSKDVVHTLNDGDLVRCGSTLLKFLKEGKIENIHYGKMYNLATQDDLTQTFNKKAILEILAEEFSRSIARSTSLTLIMFDIDHFKNTNDRFGHLAGDYVLKEVCSLIKNKLIRGKDSLGRYGGEEFALLLPDTPLQIAVDIAERIRTTIEKTQFRFDIQDIPVTISMGLSSRDSTTKSHGDLLATADKALYDAKNQGRNRVCVR